MQCCIKDVHSVLFSLLFLPLKKPHTVGVKRLEDQKRQRLVCGKLLEDTKGVLPISSTIYLYDCSNVPVTNYGMNKKASCELHCTTTASIHNV